MLLELFAQLNNTPVPLWMLANNANSIGYYLFILYKMTAGLPAKEAAKRKTTIIS